MEYYPYTFRADLREAGWGGSALRSVCGKKCSARTRIAESGELSEASVVDQGPRKGDVLAKLVREDPEGILGTAVCDRAHNRFPLAVRLLEARAAAPLEVFAPERPGDDGPPARTAAWYVIRAESGAQIRRGLLPGTEPGAFRDALAAGAEGSLLYGFAARPGDVVFLPPGTVHSLGPGVLVYEVAQNSGITHRLRDPGRSAAPAKLARALEDVDFRSMGMSRCEPVRVNPLPRRRDLLVKCERFALELFQLRKRLEEDLQGQRFVALTCVAGRAVLEHAGAGGPEVPLPAGRTALLPARLGMYTLAPDPECTVIRATIE